MEASSDSTRFEADQTLNLRLAQRGKILASIARFVLLGNGLPNVENILPFSEAVRRSLIRARTDNSHSEAITGKTSDGVPLEGHSHAHYIPTDEDGDGRLDHLTIYASRGFDEEDQVALGQVNNIFRGGGRPDVRMVLTGLGDARQFPDVPLFQSAKRYCSVTPFSLPRFANRGGGKKLRQRDLPEAQLRRELANRGLPEPVSIVAVESYLAGRRPPVRWLEFHTRRYSQSEGFGLAGFGIEFAEPQSGPLALGFACHFGLGLFLPV